MLTRRQVLHAAGAAGIAVPALSACDGGESASRPAADGPIRLVRAGVSRGSGDPSAVPGVVASIGAFTGGLWSVLAAADNLALSPYSIAVALAMTANGAVGTTRTQMLDVLPVDGLTTLNQGLDALARHLEGLPGPVTLADGTKDRIDLAPANQLFGGHGVAWRRAFLEVLAREYGAGMRTVDFHAPEAARTLINGWTSRQTHGRIPHILPPGVVDPLTRLVLVNALYLKAPWDVPFQKGLTSRKPFHRADGSTVTVDMMRSDPEGGARYLTGKHFQGARLPYRGDTLAMTVALPDPGGEAAALDELMQREHLVEDGQAGLALSMPRWTYRVATDLRPPLEALGMTRAFGDGADFSGMTTRERLHISFVLHQAFVAVDEDGTEAAAATAVGMVDSAVRRTHELVLDRPFLWVIHDTRYGVPLFVGRVADPV